MLCCSDGIQFYKHLFLKTPLEVLGVRDIGPGRCPFIREKYISRTNTIRSNLSTIDGSGLGISLPDRSSPVDGRLTDAGRCTPHARVNSVVRKSRDESQSPAIGVAEQNHCKNPSVCFRFKLKYALRCLVYRAWSIL